MAGQIDRLISIFDVSKAEGTFAFDSLGHSYFSGNKLHPQICIRNACPVLGDEMTIRFIDE